MMQQHYFNNMVKLYRNISVLLLVMFFAFFFTACLNNTTCLPLNWGEGGSIPGGNGGGGGNGPEPPPVPGGIIYIPELIPGDVVLNVYQQLAWVHNNQDQIRGGPDRLYVAIAHDPVLFPAGVFEVVPGATGIGIDFSNGSNVNVRIQSADPGPRRTIDLQGSGIMIIVN